MPEPTHAEYRLRLARLTDTYQLPDIEMAAAQRFHTTVHASAADGFPISVALLQRWLAHDGVWVAEDASGALAAFACWIPMALDMYIVELDVHPRHAGNKVGAKLLAAISAFGERVGFERMVLRTFRDVPWNAPYYRRLGFEPLGEGEEHPELRSVRQQEISVGLDSSARSTMFRSIRN